MTQEELQSLFIQLDTMLSCEDDNICRSDYPTNYVRELLKKEFKHYAKTLVSGNEANQSSNKKDGEVAVLPADYIDSEMVKRWFQKLVGLSEQEMRDDINACARAYDLEKNIKWD